jgi:hypothetical protein
MLNRLQVYKVLTENNFNSFLIFFKNLHYFDKKYFIDRLSLITTDTEYKNFMDFMKSKGYFYHSRWDKTITDLVGDISTFTFEGDEGKLLPFDKFPKISVLVV